jgi:glutaredoxin
VTIAPTREVVLYSGPGCGLCEAARRALEQLATRHTFRFREIDIHSDPVLARRWLLEIPVIEVDGEVVTRAPIDLDAVIGALRRRQELPGRGRWLRKP